MYHYICGRDDVWLENGVIYSETAHGPAESITDADGLQALIDRAGVGRLVFRHTNAGWIATNKQIGSDFDDFLREEGIYGDVSGTAMQRVREWQAKQ
jgi:hypothetical protein